MLKDINGNPIPKTKNNEEITIDYLMEYASYTTPINKMNKIIGFARYNPHDNTNHNFRNQLITGGWYPIEKFYEKAHGVFNLVGYKNSHFSLFDKIVALPEHEDKFKSILATNPTVKEYWARKEKEAIELEKSRQEMFAKLDKEKQEYIDISKDLGKEPPKISVLNIHLQKKSKKSELFSLLIKDEKLREEVKKDLDFRIKKVMLSKSIDPDKSYYHVFSNRFDKRHFSKLKKIKEVFENFDFSSEKDLNNMIKEENKLEREKRFEEGKATIFDILSKKTEEVSNKVFKPRKRKI